MKQKEVLALIEENQTLKAQNDKAIKILKSWNQLTAPKDLGLIGEAIREHTRGFLESL